MAGLVFIIEVRIWRRVWLIRRESDSTSKNKSVSLLDSDYYSSVLNQDQSGIGQMNGWLLKQRPKTTLPGLIWWISSNWIRVRSWMHFQPHLVQKMEILSNLLWQALIPLSRRKLEPKTPPTTIAKVSEATAAAQVLKAIQAVSKRVIKQHLGFISLLLKVVFNPGCSGNLRQVVLGRDSIWMWEGRVCARQDTALSRWLVFLREGRRARQIGIRNHCLGSRRIRRIRLSNSSETCTRDSSREVLRQQ